VQATAAGRDSVVGATTGTFCVLAQPVEVARLGLRADRLRAIAEAGHGEYIPAESLGVRGLNLRTSTLTRMFRWDVRHSPVAYALAALLAGIEWLLRRKRGML
jgi:hypothetical protein